MVSRRSSKTNENRAVTPEGGDAVASPRSRKCLNLSRRGNQPFSEVNGWSSVENSKNTPKKAAVTESEYAASPDIFSQTPAPSSPAIIPRTPAQISGWCYTDITTPRSMLGGPSRRSLLVTPRRHSTANTPSPSSNFVLPQQFRITPSSLIKKENKSEMPEVNLPKIKTSSFYGEKESSLSSSSPNTSAGSAKLQQAALSETRKNVARVMKRETSASKFRRSSAVGGVKRKRDKGVNKGGFGHGIKRPKKKIRVNIKVSEMKARSIEIPGSKVASSAASTSKSAPSTPYIKTPATRTPSAVTTPKTGNIAVTKETNVKYELKGGQIVYRRKSMITPRRRSPRKHQMSPMKASYFNGEKPKPPKSRLSGGRLFSPATNFMQPEVMSPEKHVPSPVKFRPVSTDDDEEEGESNNISDLINRLGVDEDEGGPSGTPPPSIPSHTLNNSGLELNLQSGDIAAMTINTGGGFVDLDSEITAYNAVQDILGNLGDSTTESDSSIDIVREDNKPSEQKMFPIFYKETAQTNCYSPSHDKQKGRRTFICKDARQLVLDAGQERGPTQCLTCGAVYTKGNVEDESSHNKTHNAMNEKLKFIGWKKERKCFEDLDGRIVIVQPGDARHMWNKVNDVISVVDKDLGFSEPGKIRNPEKTKAFLYIIEKKVVGCTLAEAIDTGFRVIPEAGGPENSYTCSTTAQTVLVGISRIWVLSDHRKQGIASKLVDSVRNFFILGQFIKQDELAFSDPTMDGMDFASNYMKKKDFLVYR